MPMPPLPDLASMSLTQVAHALAEQRLPPVESWHPTHYGDSEMRIATDGTWFHQGSPIGRETMVRLFASILRREQDGGYVLVTPAEKLDIAVDDVPFLAVEVISEGEGRVRRLTFRTNVGDLVVAGPDHRLRFADADAPYLHVRGGLDARIVRPVFYELAEWALADDAAQPGVWSDGVFFPMAA